MDEQLIDISPFDSSANIGIVVSTYYKDIADGLLTGVMNVFDEHPQIKYEIARVAGAWEIPLASRVMVQTRRFQAIIALGCVIRGETSHFDYLCQQCSAALMSISMDFTIPLSFGVLTVENYTQAQQRSDTEDMNRNKGYEAAISAIGSLAAIAQVRQDY